MPFHRHVLANGLEVIGEVSPSARSVALGFFVRTGARDETPEVSGVSHFLEHMAFKGTSRRTALDVNRDFDRIGAHYNAFTSEENTVYYAAFLPEYLPQAVDVLADILRPSLRDDDFEVEKKVIIEEIGMYEDQPMWSAYDQAKRLYFADHPLGNSILGTVESIQNLTRDQMRAYFERRYVPPNIFVAAAGNLAWPQLVRLVEEHCGSWAGEPVAKRDARPAQGSGAFSVVAKEKVAQEHVILISPGPAVNSPERYAADILAMALGDDTGSRLYWAVVDPGLADSADTSFHDYEGTGSFVTSFSCEPGQADTVLGIVQRVLAEVQRDGILEAELQQAKSKVLSRLVRGSERPMGRLRAIGMCWSYLHEYRTTDDELKAFDAVSLGDVRAVLERYPLTQQTVLALGPLTQLQPRSDKASRRPTP